VNVVDEPKLFAEVCTCSVTGYDPACTPSTPTSTLVELDEMMHGPAGVLEFGAQLVTNVCSVPSEILGVRFAVVVKLTPMI
jgi:hypothetical protein